MTTPEARYTVTTAAIEPGARAFTVGFLTPETVVGMAVALDRFHPDLRCEIRRIVAIDGTRVTVNAPFRFPHDATTLVEITPEMIGHLAYWNADPTWVRESAPAVQAALTDSDTKTGGGYLRVRAQNGSYRIGHTLYMETMTRLEGCSNYATWFKAAPDFAIQPNGTAMIMGIRDGMVSREQGGPTTRAFLVDLALDCSHVPGLDAAQLTFQQPCYLANPTITNCAGRALVATGQQLKIDNLTILRSREGVVCQNMLILDIDVLNVEANVDEHDAQTFVRFDTLPDQPGTGSGQITVKTMHFEGNTVRPMVDIPAGYDIKIVSAIIGTGGAAKGREGDQVVFRLGKDTSGCFENIRFTGQQARTIAIVNEANGKRLHAVEHFDGHIDAYTWGRGSDWPNAAASVMHDSDNGSELAFSRSRVWTFRASSNTGAAVTATAHYGRALVGDSDAGAPLWTTTATGGVHHARTIGGPGAAWTVTNGAPDHTGTSEGTAAMIWNHELGQAVEFLNTNPDNTEPVATFHQRSPAAVDAVRLNGGAFRMQIPATDKQPAQTLYAIDREGAHWFTARNPDGTTRDAATIRSGHTRTGEYLEISVIGRPYSELPVLRVESRNGVPMFGVHGRCAPQAPALPPRVGRQTITREAVRIDAITACLVAAGLMEDAS